MRPLALALLLCAPPAWSQSPVSALAVDQYKKLALELSPEVRQAREAFVSAQDAYKSQFSAALLPAFSLTGQAYPYGHNPYNSHQFSHWDLKPRETNITTSLSWNLFNSFADYHKTRQAGLSRKAADQSLKAALQARAFEAVKTFYDLSVKNHLLEVARQNLAAQEEQYRQTQDLYRGGLKSLSDLLKSENDWRSSELRMVSAAADRKTSLMAFNLLIDRPAWQAAELKADLETGATALPRLEADLPKAVESRPEVERAKLELEKARTAVDQALQGALPALAVNANWSRQDSGKLGVPPSSLTTPNPNYQLGLTLSMPINFNVASQVFNVLAARADRRKAESGLSAALRQVRQDLSSAHIALERSVESWRIASLQLDIAARNLELVMEQYRQGSTDVFFLAQARTDHLSASVARALALHDIFINRALYKLALGEPLW